jgi:hypothetical protein
MPLSASRVFLAGSWTQHGTGIFRPGYDVALGGYVGSRRDVARLARKRGLVRKEDVTVASRREYPGVEEFERALSELRPSEVEKHREAREHMEYEERAGRAEPLTDPGSEE